MVTLPFIRTVKVAKRVTFDLASEHHWIKIYRCIYKARGYSLGIIKFEKKTDQYVYYPTSNTVLTPDSLKDIVEFLAEVNRK